MSHPVETTPTVDAPKHLKPRHKRSAGQDSVNPSMKALQAACLTAGLATAFAADPTPARADLLTDQNVEIFNATGVTYNFGSSGEINFSTSSITDSRLFTTQTGSLNDYGIVVFTSFAIGSSGASSLQGTSWSDLFPTVDESQLLDYLHGGSIAGEADNYTSFLGALSSYSLNASVPGQFQWRGTVFSNGVDVGSVPTALTPNLPASLFGVARHINAVPEAGSAFGLLVLAALSAAMWRTSVWRGSRQKRASLVGAQCNGTVEEEM